MRFDIKPETRCNASGKDKQRTLPKGDQRYGYDEQEVEQLSKLRQTPHHALPKSDMLREIHSAYLHLLAKQTATHRAVRFHFTHMVKQAKSDRPQEKDSSQCKHCLSKCFVRRYETHAYILHVLPNLATPGTRARTGVGLPLRDRGNSNRMNIAR